MPVTSFIVRRLGPGDEGALQASARRDHRFEDDDGPGTPSVPLDHDGAAAFLRDPSVLCWLAEHDGTAIGLLLCYVQRRRAGGEWAELALYEIGVDVDWRRRGVGRALLDAMRRWMQAHDVHEVWVPSSPAAVGFYRACGFAADDAVLLSQRIR